MRELMCRHLNRLVSALSHVSQLINRLSPLALPPHCSCSHLPVLRAPSEPGTRATALPSSVVSPPCFFQSFHIAMAGAMKTFLVAFLVIAVTAVAVHAHNGEDHGPSSSPEPAESGGATLVASLMAPLLVAAGAFVASALQL